MNPKGRRETAKKYEKKSNFISIYRGLITSLVPRVILARVIAFLIEQYIADFISSFCLEFAKGLALKIG